MIYLETNWPNRALRLRGQKWQLTVKEFSLIHVEFMFNSWLIQAQGNCIMTAFWKNKHSWEIFPRTLLWRGGKRFSPLIMETCLWGQLVDAGSLHLSLISLLLSLLAVSTIPGYVYWWLHGSVWVSCLSKMRQCVKVVVDYRHLVATERLQALVGGYEG